jgi:hypothetical protein
MSAFGDKADIANDDPQCLLMTQSGHCDLSIFDNFNRDVATRLALERALVVIWLVGFNPRKPHRCTAFGTVRMFEFVEG